VNVPCFNTGSLLLDLLTSQGWKAKLTLIIDAWLYTEMIYI